MSALSQRIASLITDPNPILLKELRATFRTNLFVRFLYLVTGAIAMCVLAIGAVIASGELPPATVGQVLFQLFLGAGLFVIFLVAPGYASASITAEREQETWESLELSGMTAWRVVWGKLAACYASIALVLVALSPVVGIAFLFGGVSPVQVLVGFGSLLLVLVPAVAHGVAISARLRSTRLAIVLATVTFFPIGLFGVFLMVLLGDEVRSAWGIGMAGPFFYTEAFATRADEWDTWAYLGAAPLWAIGMPVWFLLATAVAGVRPAAEDRAKPMKLWAIVMTITSLPAAALLVSAQASSRDAGEWGVVTCMAMMALSILYGVLFTNEPPLPPRSWDRRRATLPSWKRALGIVGPGAAGTMRFSLLLSLTTAVLVTGAVIGTRHLLGFHSWRYDVACIVLALGAFPIAAFAASLGAYLRIVLANGLAARVLTLSLLMAGAVLPFLAALLIDPDSLDDLDDRSPLVVMVSTLEPLFLAVQAAEGNEEIGHVWQIAIPATLYGGAALFFAVMVEVRVARARREREARRRVLEESTT